MKQILYLKVKLNSVLSMTIWYISRCFGYHSLWCWVLLFLYVPINFALSIISMKVMNDVYFSRHSTTSVF